MHPKNAKVERTNYNTQFDLSNYSKGIYFLRIIGENNEAINKIIVKE